jgi:hypothetical protein
VGKLVQEQKPEKTLKLRILDPACGSGSFLIRAFERVCEHWQVWLTAKLPAPTAQTAEVDWEEISSAHRHQTGGPGQGCAHRVAQAAPSILLAG